MLTLIQSNHLVQIALVSAGPLCECVCLVLCNFITCECSRIHHHSQDPEQFLTTQSLPSSLITTLNPHAPQPRPNTTTLPIPLPVSSQVTIESVLHFYNLVMTRMLYKWNQTVCKLFGISFFPPLSTLLWIPVALYQ